VLNAVETSKRHSHLQGILSMKSLIQESYLDMRKISIFLYLYSLCAALMLAALPLSAQQDQAALSFQTTNGQSTFHIGERIPLKLTFSSPNDTEYLIAPLVRGRGDEFDCNRFEVVSPAAGWSDPLEMYFKQDLIRTGHGWSWPPLKRAKPVEASLDLNEWIRFDQPGDYTIKVTSFCVSKVQGAVHYSLSKTIKLQIVPATPEWPNEKFKSLQPNLNLLDQSAPQAQPGESSQSQWERRGELFENARADLKYLATPAAIDEMTYRLRDEKYNFADQCSMGLTGLPPTMRETAIASMNKRIEEPDFPITQWFFSTLSFLHVTPGSEKESIRKQREAINPVIWSAIFSAVTKKEPVARAQTVQTLLGYGRSISTPEVKQQMASLLSESFVLLDNRSQIDGLRQHWDLLRSPRFVPVLRSLAELPPLNDGASGPYSRDNLKSIAFKRWYELDPQGADREILAQIGSATPSLSGQALAFLPPERLPEFEPLWAMAFVATTDQLEERVLGSLLVRFGTGAATPQMLCKLDAPIRSNSCDSHVLALGYLARFSPDQARPRLKREIATNESECGGNLLQWISERATAPVLNEVALEDLDSLDTGILRDALHYLTSYGMTQDKEPIWRRYVKWAQAGQAAANGIDHTGSGPLPERDDWLVGQELGEALIANQGWLADQALISSVLEKCVGELMCKALNDSAAWAKPPYRVSLPDTTDPLGVDFPQVYGIAQYGTKSLALLVAKLRQYPAGTKFVLWSTWADTEDQHQLEREVQAIFTKNGMSLERSNQ
jgi:hypothetical protein